MDAVQVKLLIGMFITIVNIAYHVFDEGCKERCKKILGRVVILCFGIAAFVMPTENILMQTFAVLFMSTQLYKFLENMEITEIEPIKTLMTSIFK